MPTFDVVSEVDQHELTNAVDQANREIGNRFDFKGSDSRISQKDENLTIESESDFQVKQIEEILRIKLAKRGIDVACLESGEITITNNRAQLPIKVLQGIDKDSCRKIVKLVKETKIKVQAAIQSEQVRITGKKRDDLQQIMAMLREADLELPLQFQNFRD